MIFSNVDLVGIFIIELVSKLSCFKTISFQNYLVSKLSRLKLSRFKTISNLSEPMFWGREP